MMYIFLILTIALYCSAQCTLDTLATVQPGAFYNYSCTYSTARTYCAGARDNEAGTYQVITLSASYMRKFQYYILYNGQCAPACSGSGEGCPSFACRGGQMYNCFSMLAGQSAIFSFQCLDAQSCPMIFNFTMMNYCGDGVCVTGETCQSCAQDCCPSASPTGSPTRTPDPSASPVVGGGTSPSSMVTPSSSGKSGKKGQANSGMDLTLSAGLIIGLAALAHF